MDKKDIAMAYIIKDMLVDDRIILNVKTEKEAETFIDLCDILDIEKKAEDSTMAEVSFSMYKEDLCFTLEEGCIEYSGIRYFESNRRKDYRIVTIDDLL